MVLTERIIVKTAWLFYFYRNSLPKVFCKKIVLKNFAKFAGNTCARVSFNKVAGAVCNFIKKEAVAQVFPCEFSKIFKNTIFYRTLPVAASDSNWELIEIVIERRLQTNRNKIF